ncbi:MAG: cysteine--tRNA ligase [Patescibacteria group bacterium]
MQIYNTLTKQKEEFLPAGSPVRMFVCGPTVYDYIHIGNARTFVIFDVVAKWLRHQGYDLTYIQNITDIEDKIITRAAEHNKDVFAYSRELENAFYKDTQVLGITSPEYKRATDHIPEVIKQVQQLTEKGYAYLIEGDGWYFDLTKFPEYGKLSGRTAMMADDAVSRIDENDKKRNRGDFCLWKLSKEGEPSWPSELGAGRPGWHIEDTAITEKYLGQQYDLHGGGMDLMFPHHEAEIAQMEAISGKKPFVKFWMHSGFLVNKNAKMSKSLGNFMTAHEALEHYSPEALRFYFLSAHYRSPLDYSEDNLKQAEAATARLGECVAKVKRFEDEMLVEHNTAISTMIRQSEEAFAEALDDDFNTPQALAVLFDLLKAINPLLTKRGFDMENGQRLLEFFEMVHSVLGVVPGNLPKLPKTLEMLIDQRERARHSKDYALADKLRNQIEEQGYKVDDTTYGPLIKKL